MNQSLMLLDLKTKLTQLQEVPTQISSITTTIELDNSMTLLKLTIWQVLQEVQISKILTIKITTNL